jgi:hypothetical protein
MDDSPLRAMEIVSSNLISAANLILNCMYKIQLNITDNMLYCTTKYESAKNQAIHMRKTTLRDLQFTLDRLDQIIYPLQWSLN